MLLTPYAGLLGSFWLGIFWSIASWAISDLFRPKEISEDDSDYEA